jgi:transposase
MADRHHRNAQKRNISQKIVKRAKIVLITADGAGVMRSCVQSVCRRRPFDAGRTTLSRLVSPAWSRPRRHHDARCSPRSTLRPARSSVSACRAIVAKNSLKFLRRIDKETLSHLDPHLILDNYATHKTPALQCWLKRHPRFKLHFTPTSSSWLNLVERLFAEITRQRIRRGVFYSVPKLEAAIIEMDESSKRPPKTLRMDRDGRVYHSQTPPCKRGSRQSPVGCK